MYVFPSDKTVKYESDCAFCKHLKLGRYSCIAFPNGIPRLVLEGKKKHQSIIEGQVGTTVFEKFSI